METKVTDVQEKLVEKVKRVDRLARLGFLRVASDLVEILETKRKLAVAYEFYRYVTPEKIALFNMELMKKTGKNMGDAWAMEYQRLDFTPIGAYEAVPPEGVLTKLEEAQDRQCFDAFEIAAIKNVKDPLLFGRVKGSPNYFFIDQWDDDVSIDQLLKENEG